MKALFKAKEKGQFLLYGYCLMDNHVHLLLKENEEIGRSIKRITVSYVQRFNNKYGREGHLFQNRYRSEVVENEAYLLVVIRYIHQNPIKAKIVETIKDYKWSSYNKYIDKYNGKNVEIDTEIIKSYFKNKESFERYMNEVNNVICLDYCKKKKYTDVQLKAELQRKYPIKEINKMTKDERNKLIYNIKKDTGTSIRQLSRVLGVGRGLVEKVMKR